jgi:hypothetical protein
VNGRSVAVVACREAPGFEAPAGTFAEFMARIDGETTGHVVARVDSRSPDFFGDTQPLLGRMFAAEEYRVNSPVAPVVEASRQRD